MTDKHLDRIREQFTRTADVYARMRQTTDARGLEALVGISGVGATDRALDVACGPGFLTLALARCCTEAVGVDATDAFLGLARAEAADCGLENVRFEHGDAESLSFEDSSFDLVSCRAAFHHFPRPERVLVEMTRVLSAHGRILVADLLGSEDAEQSALHDRIERLCDPTHVRALAQSQFARLFADARLTMVQQLNSSLDYDVDEWIAHGAPGQDTRREIVDLMESCVDDDRAGLHVRRENGRLRFSHKVAVFVLDRAFPG